MKELNICDYELISGGILPIAIAMDIGASRGIASHIGKNM